ncbi:MAG: nitroreductase family protein [Chloroflexota bacterium]|nr:nitroreductase family protein [Chloroflexota bacterium]
MYGDFFFSRRSLRRYLPDPVPQALINQLVEAATWAPSAHNRQPWRFAVTTNSVRKQHLARAMGLRLRHDLEHDGMTEDLIAKDTARSYSRITGAPVLIVVCLSMMDMDTYPDDRRQQHEFLMAAQSTAMAGQNLLLAAHALGLGACWMCAPLFAPDVVREALELPHDWQPQGMVTLGYPAEFKEKTRRPLETSMVWR